MRRQIGLLFLLGNGSVNERIEMSSLLAYNYRQPDGISTIRLLLLWLIDP